MPTSFGPRTLDIAGLRRARGLETEPPLSLLRDASRSLLGVRTVQLLILFWVICGASVFLSSQAPSAQWLNTSPWSKSLRQFLQLSTDVSVAVFTVHFVRSWKDFRRTMNWYFLGFSLSFLAGVVELADGYLRSDWAARLTELLHTFGPRQYMASGFRLQLLAYEPSIFLLDVSGYIFAWGRDCSARGDGNSRPDC